MPNRFHTERITFLVHPEDKKKLTEYCEKNQKNMTMVLRNFVQRLTSEV